MQALFPDIIGDRYSRKRDLLVNKTMFGSQRPARYRRWMRPRWSFGLGWSLLEKADCIDLEDFLHAMYGGFTPCDWYDWRPFEWIWVPVGTGDGIETAFMLPAKETSVQFFFANGATQIYGTMSYGVGSHGEDQITFDSPPASGAAITAQFYGRRKFSVTVEDVEHFSYLQESVVNYQFGATLVEDK